MLAVNTNDLNAVRKMRDLAIDEPGLNKHKKSIVRLLKIAYNQGKKDERALWRRRLRYTKKSKIREEEIWKTIKKLNL